MKGCGKALHCEIYPIAAFEWSATAISRRGVASVQWRDMMSRRGVAKVQWRDMMRQRGVASVLWCDMITQKQAF